MKEFEATQEDIEKEFYPEESFKKSLMRDAEKIASYDKGVDYEFFEGMGIRVVKHQPWQLGLFHEELEGKFLWYPRAGTLVYERERGRVSRIGEKGQFEGVGENSTEKVYEEIMKKVYEN